MYIHVTLVPYIKVANEVKTKPTQHSVKELRSLGIQPDVLVCRTEKRFPNEVKEKLALFCDTDLEAVIQEVDAASIYEVPLMLEEEGLARIVLKRLGIKCGEPDLADWENMVHRMKNLSGNVVIGLVGKYVSLPDAYLSVAEALRHASLYHGFSVDIKWINAEDVEKTDPAEYLKDVDGILVPGGFGDRGIEGKIRAINYARVNNIPFLGICLGMQLAVVEFCRNVLGWKDANSCEFNADTCYPVIDLLPEQKSLEEKGGTMRLGQYPCKLVPGTLAYKAYDQEMIYERHRHRYELNNQYRSLIEEGGMVISGTLPDDSLAEIVELPKHPWFLATQFHPEFKSRPNRPHPLFKDFVGAAIRCQKK